MTKLAAVRPPRPRLINEYSKQHYRTRVKPAFDAMWNSLGGSVPRSERLSMTQDFIVSSWNAESEQFRADFEEEVMDAYHAAVDRFNRANHYTQSTPQSSAE
jgi:hypothetical protein